MKDSTLLTILVVILIFAVALAISFGFTTLLVWLVCLAFSWTFTWRVAFGIWILTFLFQAAFGTRVINRNKDD